MLHPICAHGFQQSLGSLTRCVAAVDSIAAPIRYEEGFNGRDDSSVRSDLLFKVAAALKLMASKYKCAAIVSNQVVDLMSESVGPSSKIPALGDSFLVPNPNPEPKIRPSSQPRVTNFFSNGHLAP